MERDLYGDLLDWRSSPQRKPLLLRGARQTGKTFLLKQFADREYERLVYCNFEEDPGLDGFFRRDLDPHRIVAELSVYKGFDIDPRLHLIVFDEVQACDRALTSLKYFQEEAAEYHVAAAGSLLGIRMSGPGSFPVGKVSFLDLHPMSFLEFLGAVGKPRYADLLRELTEPEPLPEAVHTELIDLLRAYYFIGGMPEAVDSYAHTGDARLARRIQREVLDSYVLDFAKHAPATDIPRLSLIWDSIPTHLAKENKKFMFSVVKQGARAREYENALRWIQDAGLVHSCYAASTSRAPLEHYAERNVFKVYALDVGLLGAMTRTEPKISVEGDRLFTEYRGALAENYVAQQLVASGQPGLYYWRSAGGKAELDFLCEVHGAVVPIEVKAGLSRKSKSLRSYDQQFAPDVLVRANLLNLKRDGKICNVPLYAISAVRQFL
jgi:predicted AAA+ superfamily ATPase